MHGCLHPGAVLHSWARPAARHCPGLEEGRAGTNPTERGPSNMCTPPHPRKWNWESEMCMHQHDYRATDRTKGDVERACDCFRRHALASRACPVAAQARQRGWELKCRFRHCYAYPSAEGRFDQGLFQAARAPALEPVRWQAAGSSAGGRKSPRRAHDTTRRLPTRHALPGEPPQDGKAWAPHDNSLACTRAECADHDQSPLGFRPFTRAAPPPPSLFQLLQGLRKLEPATRGCVLRVPPLPLADGGVPCLPTSRVRSTDTAHTHSSLQLQALGPHAALRQARLLQQRPGLRGLRHAHLRRLQLRPARLRRQRPRPRLCWAP